jgi:hypothetical protein
MYCLPFNRYSGSFLILFLCSFPVGIALAGMSYAFSNRVFFYVALGLISVSGVVYLFVLVVDVIIHCITHVTVNPISETTNPQTESNPNTSIFIV